MNEDFMILVCCGTWRLVIVFCPNQRDTERLCCSLYKFVMAGKWTKAALLFALLNSSSPSTGYLFRYKKAATCSVVWSHVPARPTGTEHTPHSLTRKSFQLAFFHTSLGEIVDFQPVHKMPMGKRLAIFLLCATAKWIFCNKSCRKVSKKPVPCDCHTISKEISSMFEFEIKCFMRAGISLSLWGKNRKHTNVSCHKCLCISKCLRPSKEFQFLKTGQN